ncbi:MAG: hypothetical protein FJ279_11285 [Planctomycetes bacterium]|nr:hypothetical protein [Planctomycetota bacterium]MBM4080709.1 hypothetical protein [Planctomycetota bacterium]
MKTTLEIPDELLHRAEAAAAERGQPFGQLVADALAEKLQKVQLPTTQVPWRKGFGAFRDERQEIERIQRVIDEEFSRINPEDWK